MCIRDRFFTVYAIDLPGFGDSPVHKDVNYDQQYIAKAVVDFVAKKKLSKLTLVGEELFCFDSKLAYPINDGIPILLVKEARELTPEELAEKF